MNPTDPPSVGQALFGVAFFVLVGCLFLSLIGDESAKGNPIFGIALAGVMFAMALWRATYVVKATRARRAQRQ